MEIRLPDKKNCLVCSRLIIVDCISICNLCGILNQVVWRSLYHKQNVAMKNHCQMWYFIHLFNCEASRKTMNKVKDWEFVFKMEIFIVSEDSYQLYYSLMLRNTGILHPCLQFYSCPVLIFFLYTFPYKVKEHEHTVSLFCKAAPFSE